MDRSSRIRRIVVQSSPMRYDGAPPLPHDDRSSAPARDVLGWLGLSRDDVARLAKEG
jgi:hypothetical protein